MTGKSRAYLTAVTGPLLGLAYILHLMGFATYQHGLLLLSTVIAGIPILIKALQALRMKAFSIELLVSIAIIGALFIGEYVESAIVSFLFIFGAYLEARTLEKTRSSLRSLMDLAPVDATVLRNGEQLILSIDEVVKGDRVVIRSGGKVPVDGRVMSGQAYINEAAITGESTPANKQMNDVVFSGTMVDHGYIEVVAEKIGEDTTYARMIELVEEAQESKTRTEKFLEKFANLYTPSIVVLSIILYLFTRNIELALTFLVIACPGALVISAPVSIVAGIGNGAKHGVLIKGGEVMERLARVDTVVFDKTGTLTKGRPEVTEVRAFSLSENGLLEIIAEAEMISEHHLGQTIVREARARKLLLTNKPEDVEIIKGCGIRARITGRQLTVGNRKLMALNGIPITPEVEAYAKDREQQGNTAVFAALDDILEGIISIADQIRPEAEETINQLKAAGIKHFYMLTGDNPYAAAWVAARLGIDHVYAEMLPENKVAKVQELKAAGRFVAMAGDGINDAPAIATADIGLAMGISGTDVTMETADVVLMADKLNQFPYAYSLAKATVKNMKQNTYFAVGTVALLLLGVILQTVFLATGMLIHELSVLLVILNAIRLVRYKVGS